MDQNYTYDYDISIPTGLLMPTACTKVLWFLCTYPEVLIAIGLVLIVHGNENPFQHVLVCKFHI